MSTKTYTIYDGKILVNEGKNKTTYYLRVNVEGKRKKINLGHELNLALQKLREIESTGSIQPKTVDQVWALYSKTNLIERAKSTQRNYKLHYDTLQKVFGNIKLEDIKSWHIVEYLRTRRDALMDQSKENSGISANREIALLSILFTYARNELRYEGMNPCNGIKRVKESGRAKYIEKWEYEKIYEAGDPVLQDVLDLLLYTGQRVGDILKMKTTDIYKNVDLTTTQMSNGQIAAEVLGTDKADLMKVLTNKTRKKIDIVVEGELRNILDRILEHRTKNKINSLYLIADKDGKPFNYYRIYNKYRKARKLAGFKSFKIQLRDLRHKNAADDTLENANIRLAHTSTKMTEHYRNNVMGVIARPLTKLK